MASSNSTFSVIGSDVTIKGDIAASADLHVDGSIEGDIKCTSVVQGESSLISGAITADNARMSGRVTGSITAKELVILKTAKIEGDVHYDALTIEQGAQVDGRFAPNASKPAPKAVPEVKPVERVEPAKKGAAPLIAN
ncbi:MAG: polymer-forming cytoskeletal protein [Pseudomonadota bacterium]